jgi:hypothetical protein
MELSGTTRQVPSFYLTILFPLSVSGKLTGTLSGFIARVKPAPFGLLCAWRELLILRQQISQLQHGNKTITTAKKVSYSGSTYCKKNCSFLNTK